MKESVLSFEQKTTQPWFTYFQINPLNTFLYDFSIMIIRI